MPLAAARRSSVQGCATRANGRSWVLIAGSVSSKKGVTAAFVAGSLRMGESRDRSAGSRTSAKVCTPPSVRSASATMSSWSTDPAAATTTEEGT